MTMKTDGSNGSTINSTLPQSSAYFTFKYIYFIIMCYIFMSEVKQDMILCDRRCLVVLKLKNTLCLLSETWIKV